MQYIGIGRCCIYSANEEHEYQEHNYYKKRFHFTNALALVLIKWESETTVKTPLHGGIFQFQLLRIMESAISGYSVIAFQYPNSICRTMVLA